MPDQPDTNPSPGSTLPGHEPRMRSLAPLAAGFVLLVAAVVAAGFIVRTQAGAAAEMRRSFDLRNQIATLLSVLQNAETGQRGYLLTGDEAYLKPYEAALPQAEAGLRTVAEAFAAEPDLTASVDTLKAAVRGKFDELGRTVALRREGRTDEALALVRSNEGKRFMDKARQALGSLAGAVADRLRARQAAVAATAYRLQAAISVAVLLAVALAAYAILDARARTRRLVRAHASLRDAYDALVVANDTRERLESDLRQAQKMEAMGHLTGGIAHDFNNMLAVVMGNLHLLKRRLGAEGNGVRVYADQALDAGVRAAALTQRLLAFARKQPLAPEAVDCNRLLAGMSDILRRSLGEGIEVETILASGLWQTEADPNQLESALLNLAVNARDAMSGTGKITIETANAHLDEAYAARNLDVPTGQYVRIAVGDTGIGMTPEVAAQAFDPFFTTKQVDRGTGLGLSQVYGFVKQSGGHVSLRTEPGRGTTVTIHLPRRIAGARPAPARGPDTGPVPEGRPDEIILVVEDDDAVRRVAVEALRELRYTVVHADGAAPALRIVEANPGIALLFTDVVMPEISGRELADAVRKMRPALPVLYTTGYARNAIAQDGEAQVLGKPYTLEQLARKVRQALAVQAA